MPNMHLDDRVGHQENRAANWKRFAGKTASADADLTILWQCGQGASIIPPPPGCAVLACACGKMLDLADMTRPRRSLDQDNRNGTYIDPICCRRCADVLLR
jgi:hypothetical protein